jgi:hypothetical protein
MSRANRVTRHIEGAKICVPSEGVWHREDAACDLQNEKQSESSEKKWTQFGRVHGCMEVPIWTSGLRIIRFA